MEKELSVLFVDDSRVFRSILESLFTKIGGVRIAGSVWNGEKALEFLQSQSVDLVTLDVEMPGLGGLETLRQIAAMDESRRPAVLMISSLTRSGADTTMRALEMGAFDFIAKPGSEMQGAAESLERMLALKLKGLRNHMHSRSAGLHASVPAWTPSVRAAKKTSKTDVVVIGISTGGPRALASMLPDLIQMIQCPVLIVQHMPPQFTRSLAQTLDKKCTGYTVVEASGGMPVKERHVYVAPGGFHMVVIQGRQGVEIALNEQEPEHGCRPSVDVLFRSVASVYSEKSIVAVVMTGMGCDGTAGIRMLKSRGAWCIAQDESSSVVWGMPGSVVDAGLADDVVPLANIPEAVASRC